MKHFNLLLAAFVALVFPAALSAQDCNTPFATLPITGSGQIYNSGAVTLDERNNGTDSLWIQFTTTVEGFVTVNTCDAGANPDTRLFLYDGLTCANRNLVATSDNDCGLAALLNDKKIVPGKNYYLLLDNKTTASQLTFTVDISFVTITDYNNNRPANDSICKAAVVMVDDTLTGQSNENASVQGASEFALGNLEGIQDEWNPDFNVHNTVWYSFVAPTSGAVGIDLLNVAGWDAQLAVFSGACTSFSGLNFVAAEEGGTSGDFGLNLFCLTPGVTYYILVDGFGVSSGDFDISVKNIDLRTPYIIMFDPDTNAVPAFACPGANDFELSAELLVAADSSLINDVPTVTAYDLWYQAALTDYVNSLDWDLNNEDGSGDFAFDDDLDAGTYTAEFTDGCNTWSEDFTFVDDQRPALTLTFDSIAQPGCVGESGLVRFSVSGGFRYDDASTYNMDSVLVYVKKVTLAQGASALNNAPFIGGTFLTYNPGFPFFENSLTQGIYRLIIEDGCSNFDSLDFTMTNPTVSALQIGVTATVDPYCPSTATGSLDLFTSGGQNKPFEYTWRRTDTTTTTRPDTLFDTGNPNNAPVFLVNFDDEDFDEAQQGWYQIVVFDGCNQRDTAYARLNDPTIDDLSAVATATDPTSFAAQDGEITITPAGGNGVYFTQWFVDGVYTPEMDDMLSSSTLAQGIYQVVVSDTCFTAGDTTLFFKLLAPLANDEPCNAIEVTTADTLYTFSNEGATAASGESTALGIPNDADEGYNGWEETGVQSSVWFTFTAPQSGAVSIDVFAYQLVGNLSFDPQVAVFSASDCNDFSTFEYLAANDDFGVGNSNNSPFLEVYCLTPGEEYYILVDGFAGIGQEGCFALDIDEIQTTPIAVSYTKENIDCTSPSSGSITITNIMGGVYLTSPEQFKYKVDFNNGATVNTGVNQGNPGIVYNNLTAGTYTLSVTDTCGNLWTEDITIAPYNPGALQINREVTNPTCPGGSDGIVEITYTNGAGNYSTSWEEFQNPGNNSGGSLGGNNPTFFGFEAGVYVFEVVDDCNNIKTFEVQVQDPVLDPVVVTVTEDDPECPGEDNGSFNINYQGGSGQYLLTVRETGTEILVQGIFQDYIDVEDFEVDMLGADQYYIVIQDVCDFTDTTFQDTINITDPVFDALDIDVTEVNPSNPGAADGSFSFTISGGAMPYTVFAFELNAAGTMIVDTLDIVSNQVTGLTAGKYRLAVDDNCDNNANNFSGTVDFELLDPPAADDACDAMMVAIGTTLNGDNTAATIQTGEASGLNFPLDTLCESFAGWCLSDGIDASVWYKTTVPASGAFSARVTTSAFDPQIALFTVGDTCSNFDSFEFLAGNDDATTNPATQSYVEVGCLAPGTEVYILIDANVTSDAVNVEGAFTLTLTSINYSNLNVLGNVTNPSTEISTDGSINVQITGGLAPFTYVWEDNGTLSTVVTQDRSNLGIGSYKVTVTDACGNSKSKTFTLSQQGVSYDNVCDAVLLPIDGVTREYTNQGATLQNGEISIEPRTNGDCFSNTDTSWCSGDGLDATIWFKFYAPASGKVNVDLCNGGNNTFDTQVAVYRSNTCTNFSAFTIVGANDDFPGCALGSVLNLTNLQPCALYYILVDTDDNQRGEMGISLEDPDQGVNAGDDVTATVCEEDGTIDLTNLLAGNADQGGTFVDVNNTGALTGSSFNAALVGEGTYTINYVVSVECNNQTAASDVSTITLIVEDCVGIVENNGVSYKLFPNPSNGAFKISTQSAISGVDVSVSDFAGKEIRNVKDAFANSNVLDMNIEGVSEGVYVVRMSGNANGIFKVVVR